jgi:hypothetical protein
LRGETDVANYPAKLGNGLRYNSEANSLEQGLHHEYSKKRNLRLLERQFDEGGKIATGVEVVAPRIGNSSHNPSAQRLWTI